MPELTEQAIPVTSVKLPTLKQFLEEAPPGREWVVAAGVGRRNGSQGGVGPWEVGLPSLLLYCESEICEDMCVFDPDDSGMTLGFGNEVRHALAFAKYRCRHCKITPKTFALRVETGGGNLITLKLLKFGEDPPAIGRTPRALKMLLGEQWDFYLQGRRSEIAGLGIGAFTYYRRVVENVWQTVLARLIEVARIDGSPERLEILTKAQNENRFTPSMDAAKGEVPASLYVDGHNPFQTLYDVCGDGLHEYSDEDCIARARIIRLILARFADRAKAVLSEDVEFRQAIGGLAAKTGAVQPTR